MAEYHALGKPRPTAVPAAGSPIQAADGASSDEEIEEVADPQTPKPKGKIDKQRPKEQEKAECELRKQQEAREQQRKKQEKEKEKTAKEDERSNRKRKEEEDKLATAAAAASLQRGVRVG